MKWVLPVLLSLILWVGVLNFSEAGSMSFGTMRTAPSPPRINLVFPAIDRVIHTSVFRALRGPYYYRKCKPSDERCREESWSLITPKPSPFYLEVPELKVEEKIL
jgi:hypothetical protein